MSKKLFLYILIIGSISQVIISCRVTRPYQAPEMPGSDLYRGVNTSDTGSIGSLSWREMFNDPALLGLIDSAIARNLDLRIAYNRIQQAQAYYLQSRAAFLPSANLNLGATASKLSEAQGFGIRTSATQYQFGVATGWEADIWGRLSSSRRASFANLLRSEAAARAIQTNLVGTVADYYFNLLALDEQVKITEQTVLNWDTTVITMRALKDAARVTEAAVVQSEAQRYSAEVTIPDLKRNIRETENALSILMGNSPAGINRGNLGQQQTAQELQTGVPAQLLANRPDVQEAEFIYRNAFELTNVARTAFYPSLNITGSAGFNSLKLSQFYNPASIAASIGISIVQPVFNRRINKTNLEVARAEQEASLLNFRDRVLTAGKEVSDAIFLHEMALEKMTVRAKQMSALNKSVEFTQELLRNGFADYNEVITARQSLLQAELGMINDRLQQLQAKVNLYRSLGGGWK